MYVCVPQWVYSPSNTPNSLVALSNVVGVPALTVYPVEGTKENAPCSNRGYCNQVRVRRCLCVVKYSA